MLTRGEKRVGVPAAVLRRPGRPHGDLHPRPRLRDRLAQPSQQLPEADSAAAWRVRSGRISQGSCLTPDTHFTSLKPGTRAFSTVSRNRDGRPSSVLSSPALLPSLRHSCASHPASPGHRVPTSPKAPGAGVLVLGQPARASEDFCNDSSLKQRRMKPSNSGSHGSQGATGAREPGSHGSHGSHRSHGSQGAASVPAAPCLRVSIAGPEACGPVLGGGLEEEAEEAEEGGLRQRTPVSGHGQVGRALASAGPSSPG